MFSNHLGVGMRDAPAFPTPTFPTPVIPTAIIPTPTIPTQVNESAKQQAMESVRFYGRENNKDSKPPVMCVTGVTHNP